MDDLYFAALPLFCEDLLPCLLVQAREIVVNMNGLG